MSIAGVSAAEAFVKFVNKCPTQFHATAEIAALFKESGFEKLSERAAEWSIKPNGSYFFTRNQSSVIAFSVGGKWKPGNGFVIQGAHTDSPVLKLKPISKIVSAGYLQVGVECYGGGLWHTWWDRDLSVAGRVLVEKPDGTVVSQLVQVKDPIVRIPNLAIHLNRDVGNGFQFNKETELLPILASQLKVEATLVKDGAAAGAASTPAPAVKGAAFETSHHSVLVDRVAAELGVDPATIVDFELCLYDTQPAAITGLCKEFVSSRALDNLLMSFISSHALVSASAPATLGESEQVFITALFDNEEVGSDSAMGAGSNMLARTLLRINTEQAYDAAISRSILVSADMAHALHPNYQGKHECNHRPVIHGGLVIKENANQRYATNPTSTFHVTRLARQLGIPTQQFVVRNDSACGSTIGPILASACGLRTVDVGVPQWAMHSVRETCGTEDVSSAYTLLSALFPAFGPLDAKLIIDE
jgi:aspartyl aminopeptidase